ncbi:DUF6572 domain-containing protein [Pantoea sp. PNA 03-3]|uniref:DUF6572 domain-containing protein n=1 Tax=Pantoea sp. PNA 03-3 TaxID=2135460 RepID=UPI000D751B1F|nr:DUF6572 domain-containing protein [Pantoea sp. PNA 03-3]PXV73503.1 hypothetical protein C7433_10686 [Pantoea sp. PNA 03-3]
MSIEEVNKVDFINASDEDDELVLLGITDHLSWEDDINGHLLLLQDKVNAYLNFILSDQMRELSPALCGKSKFCIQVFFKFLPPKEVDDFFSKFQVALKEYNIDLISHHVG